MGIFHPKVFEIALGRPQRDYLFSVFIEGAPPKIFPRIRSVDHPFINVNFDELKHGKKKINFPEGFLIGDLSLTFIDGEDALVEKWYFIWLRSMFSPDGTRREPIFYEKKIIVNRHSQKGRVNFSWIFNGCAPESMSSASYGHENNSLASRTISIKVSSVKIPSVILALIQQGFNVASTVNNTVGREDGGEKKWGTKS